jgi:hypothetical protein
VKRRWRRQRAHGTTRSATRWKSVAHRRHAAVALVGPTGPLPRYRHSGAGRGRPGPLLAVLCRPFDLGDQFVVRPGHSVADRRHQSRDAPLGIDGKEAEVACPRRRRRREEPDFAVCLGGTAGGAPSRPPRHALRPGRTSRLAIILRSRVRRFESCRGRCWKPVVNCGNAWSRSLCRLAAIVHRSPGLTPVRGTSSGRGSGGFRHPRPGPPGASSISLLAAMSSPSSAPT